MKITQYKFKEKREWDVAPTLTSTEVKQTYVEGGGRIRHLTPIECERLQGFPDNWTEGIPENQRYKCLGNAVSVPVVEAVIRKLFSIEDKEAV